MNSLRIPRFSKDRFIRLLSFAFVLSLLTVSSAYPQTIDLIERPAKGRQYETLTFRFSESLHFENPFDLESNRVELLVHAPDFSRRVLSFFYDGLDKKGVEQWEARFTPKQNGIHRFSIRINGATQPYFDVPVEAHAKDKLGGLRLSDHPGLFQYESGKNFRGIGLNVCWARDYEYYFKKMRAAGVNVTRIWMCPWNLSFEWQETGLGRYNLESARRLDSILQLAEKYGIFVILCMDFHGVAPKGMGFFRENRWLANPYNKVNGGPCLNAADLFTDGEAKAFLKRKYKYIISRFGHSSNIAAWEFYNEADLMAGKAIPMNRWHIEMGEYVKSVDAHNRLVSSSSTRGSMEKLIDAFRSPAMDFVMYHDYNDLDMAALMTNLHEVGIEYYQKPIVIAEFGVEYRGADRTARIDSQHVGLHNGIWSGFFNETPIIPMSWWWDNYIDPLDLWREYASLSRFAAEVNFGTKHVVFKTVPTGLRKANSAEQASCMVRSIYFGDDCALWFKNDSYKWSDISEGKAPGETGEFTQLIPDLIPGRYLVSWFDPQTGRFFGKETEVTVKEDGVLSLPVPSLSRDLACLAKRQP